MSLKALCRRPAGRGRRWRPCAGGAFAQTDVLQRGRQGRPHLRLRQRRPLRRVPAQPGHGDRRRRITREGYGPLGQTVVFDSEDAINLYNFKHGPTGRSGSCPRRRRKKTQKHPDAASRSSLGAPFADYTYVGRARRSRTPTQTRASP